VQPALRVEVTNGPAPDLQGVCRRLLTWDVNKAVDGLTWSSFPTPWRHVAEPRIGKLRVLRLA
jgi:hypothetical protein